MLQRSNLVKKFTSQSCSSAEGTKCKGSRRFMVMAFRVRYTHIHGWSPPVLLNENEFSCHQRGRWMNDTLYKSLLNVFFHNLLFIDGQRVKTALRERHPLQEVYGAIALTMRGHLKLKFFTKNIPEVRLFKWNDGLVLRVRTLHLGCTAKDRHTHLKTQRRPYSKPT